MIVLAVVLFVIAAVEGSLLIASRFLLAEQRTETTRLWQHIEDLESDKRALTESLCRAEGKPFIPSRQELRPSDGWWDAKPEIKVTAS